MTIYTAIASLTKYAIANGLCCEEDKIYVENRVCDCLKLETLVSEPALDLSLEDILAAILDYACKKGIIDDSITSRDLFDTRIMDCYMPRPSEIIRKFNSDYEISPVTATDNYYKLSRASDYIRTYRIAKDKKWLYPCEYGDVDITINLSKPEKDPKAIAAAKNAPKNGVKYPACLLCKENEGYAGRADHPARNNHRIIPFEMAGEKFYLQYSPYVYYNEHCIVLNAQHKAMIIDRPAFDKLLCFVEKFPHYFVGSNADLPIVGGSILAHEHFQGGHYDFAMAKAPIEEYVNFEGFPDVTAGIVRWPMSVIRLSGLDRVRIAELADKILTKWRGYTDEDAFIFAETDGTPHNTITPIARKRNDNFELDLVLRNNITTNEYPDGVYHAHPEYHHLKKENIGLIEVMGLAVLPSRLKNELALLREAILDNKNITEIPEISKHNDWANMLKEKYSFNENNTAEILEQETGKVFVAILENCGVFKRDDAGRKAFLKFIKAV